MKKKVLMFSAILAFITSLVGDGASASCPDTSKGETPQDCPWAEITRATDGVTDFTKIRAIIDAGIPGFMNQVEKDAQEKELLDMWGLSSNIDASQITTGIKTIPENLLRYFVSLWKVSYNQDFTQGFAGLNHTYGYLFSNLQTKYGYKRARWVQGEIEAGLNLPAGLLSGQPKKGTLFSNLTRFIGPIAFRDLDQLPRGLHSNIHELRHYDYSKLRTIRLMEVAEDHDQYLELRTDIAPFIAPNPNGGDTALLIYSIDFRHPDEEANPKLITAFPINNDMINSVMDAKLWGNKVTLKLNYNAVLATKLSDEFMSHGKRYLLP